MPTLKKLSGLGAWSRPFRCGPSSDAKRHDRPVIAEVTSASFWIASSERTQVRTDWPCRLSGGTKPAASALAAR